MNEILQARALVKTYDEPGRSLVVLDKLDLAVREHEIICITGHSGVGKSTLLHILGLLDTPTSGSVLYRGADLADSSEAARAQLRNTEFGFVFQFYHLLPDLDALGNVMLPAMVQSEWLAWFGKSKDAHERGMRLLEQVGLADRATHKPSKLSGGEKQRVALARALANEPKIVFCDEPTGNLDERTSEQIHDLLWALNEQLGTTFVIVTHNQELADRSDRVAKIHEGKIVEIVEKNRQYKQ